MQLQGSGCFDDESSKIITGLLRARKRPLRLISFLGTLPGRCQGLFNSHFKIRYVIRMISNTKLYVDKRELLERKMKFFGWGKGLCAENVTV
jgi:hypothetical protein